MDNGPELWDKILTDLKEVFPGMNIIIAGGAVRDHRLGIEPKDIDVFINVEDDLEFEFGLHDLQQKYNVQDLDQMQGGHRYSEGNSDMKDIVGVYELGDDYRAIPVQIIGCKFRDGLDLVDKFDADIVTCYYEGGEPVYSKAAQRDMDNRTYTVRLNSDKRYKTEERFMRFRDRVSRYLQMDNFMFVDKFAEEERKRSKEMFSHLYTTPTFIPIERL